MKNGGGDACAVRQNGVKYARGAFDFLAAYVIPEDVWYIIPPKKLAGRGYVTLCSSSGKANFEEYREAWHLLREAAGVEEETAAPHPEESAGEAEEVPMDPGVRGCRRRLISSGVNWRKVGGVRSEVFPLKSE